MNNNIVFDNDPFNHIDIFHFTDFDSDNISLPRQEEINNLKVQSGHLALLNPTILKDNDIEGQLDIAMKLGIGSSTNGPNIHKINNEPLKKTIAEKKTVTRSTKIVTKKEKEKEPEDKKLQPKKRGRKATTTKTNNDDSEDECNVKLPQKYQYLEEKERLGTLTEEEEKILKKERRLIKNRESAQQFRKRQKMHTIELQEKVDKLNDENVHLKHTVDSLNKDKEQLEMQIKNLWQFVNKAFTFAVPYRVEQQNTGYQNGYHYPTFPPQHHLPLQQNHLPHPIHNTHHNPNLNINSIPHNRNSSN